MTSALLIDKHVEFIKAQDKNQDEMEFWLTQHLRTSGVYWGLVGLELMNREDALDRDQVVEYILECQNPDGGFGGYLNHDSHLLYTMSALQVLAIYDCLDRVDVDKVVGYVKNLKDPETDYMPGDVWGEKDTRFAFIAVAILSFFGRLDDQDEGIRGVVEGAIKFVEASMNYDGGFGSGPGGESHAAQVFTALAALAIVGKLDVVDRDRLSWWLCERQLKNGGLNGRPQKLEDVCYSWWVVSSLKILNRVHWIDQEKLCKFILSAQDEEKGGIADRPGDMADVYHTCFGIAGLSLAGYPGLAEVDPVYCMPVRVIERMGLDKWKAMRPNDWD